LNFVTGDNDVAAEKLKTHGFIYLSMAAAQCYLPPLLGWGAQEFLRAEKGRSERLQTPVHSKLDLGLPSLMPQAQWRSQLVSARRIKVFLRATEAH